MTEQDHQQIDIREYLRVVRVHLLLIVLVSALLVGAALFWSLRQIPIYTATARVYVETIVTTPTQFVPLPNLETESELVASIPVANRVQRETRSALLPEELLSAVHVTVFSDNQVMEVSYSSTSPEEASVMANSFAENYLNYRRDTALKKVRAAEDQVGRLIADVETRLTEIEDQIEQARGTDDGLASTLQAEHASLLARLGVLQQRLYELAPDRALRIGGGQVIESASVPKSPSSPNHLKNGLLAGVLGFAIGVALAFLKERLDNRFRDRDDVERELRAPVLNSIPRYRTGKRGAFADLPVLADSQSSSAEAYRALRTNVEFLAARREAKSLLVTSPSPGEGKTATVANLGVSFAQAGAQVILVSADMRKPVLDSRFGIESRGGLSDILSGGRVDLASRLVKDPGIANLRVLPSGPVPDNPAELLTRPTFIQLMEHLQRSADWVIVDSPPVLPVTDATILGSRLDVTLLVIDASATTTTAAKHATVELERAGATLLGVVLNGLDPRAGRYGELYRYGYGSYYGESGNGDKNGRKKKSRRRAEKAKAKSR